MLRTVRIQSKRIKTQFWYLVDESGRVGNFHNRSEASDVLKIY